MGSGASKNALKYQVLPVVKDLSTPAAVMQGITSCTNCFCQLAAELPFPFGIIGQVIRIRNAKIDQSHTDIMALNNL